MTSLPPAIALGPSSFLLRPFSPPPRAASGAPHPARFPGVARAMDCRRASGLPGGRRDGG